MFLVKRPAHGSFPDLYVLPGGKVESNDYQVQSAHYPERDSSDSQESQFEHSHSVYRITAIRECFEECGVLFARADASQLVEFDQRHSTFSEVQRDALAQHKRSFVSFLSAEDLIVAPEHLHYFGHWITPESAPRRFDTSFFLATMPRKQFALSHSTETAGGQWVNPRDALRLFANGEWRMVVPTITTLRMVAHYPSTQSLCVVVRQRRHLIPVTVQTPRQGMQPNSSAWSTG